MFPVTRARALLSNRKEALLCTVVSNDMVSKHQDSRIHQLNDQQYIIKKAFNCF